MKKLYHYSLLFFGFVTFSVCATFEPEEFIPFPTFENTLGGGGVDIGNDVVELEQGYLIVGAAGPECDIMDGVAILLDKTTGQTIQFNHFGLPGEGNEDNLFDVEKISDNEFLAAGFSAPKAEIVPYNSKQCSVYDPDYTSTEQPPYPNPDGNIFLVSFDSTLGNFKTYFVESSHPASRWDAAYSLSVWEDEIYIAGAWHAFNSLLNLDDNFAIKDSIVLGSRVGEYRDVDINRDNGVITITGFVVCYSAGVNCPTDTTSTSSRTLNFTKKNGNDLIQINYNLPPKIKETMGESINDAENGGYIMAGSAIDFQDEEYILITKITANGTELWTKVLEEKGRALDINEVEGGYVMTGNIEDDLFIMKIDLDGNEVWTEKYDYRGLGNKQEGRAIIITDDGGFLVVGKSSNSDNTSSTIYVVKTDARGKV